MIHPGRQLLHGLVVLTDADNHGLRLDAVDVRGDGDLFDVRRGIGIRGKRGDIVIGIA